MPGKFNFKIFNEFACIFEINLEYFICIFRNDVPALMRVSSLRRHSQTSHLIITLEKELEEWATYELKIHFTGKLTSPEDGDFFKVRYTDKATRQKK